MPNSLFKHFYQCLNYYGKYKHLALMKVVMVLAPGARDLKQTDKMAKPIRWIPPPTMYLKIFNLRIFQTWIDIWKYLVPKTSRDPVLQHHGRAPWEILAFLCVLFWSGAHPGWFGYWWISTYSRPTKDGLDVDELAHIRDCDQSWRGVSSGVKSWVQGLQSIVDDVLQVGRSHHSKIWLPEEEI